MPSRRPCPRTIAVVAIALILFPGVALGLAGFHSIVKQGERLRANYGATIALARDRLQAELERREADALDELRAIDPAEAVTSLRQFEARRRWLARPFLVHASGGIITVDVSFGWPGRTGHDVRRGDNAAFAHVIAEAEALELAARDPARALARYRAAGRVARSVAESAFAQARIARSLAKLGRHDEAIDASRVLLDVDPVLQGPTGVPYHVVALVQLIDAAAASGRADDADDALRALRTYLLEHPWDLAGGYAFYLSAYLPPRPDVDPASPGSPPDAPRLDELRVALRGAHWLHASVAPLVRIATIEGLAAPAARSLHVERDGTVAVVSVATEPRASAHGAVVARGFERRLDHLADELLADVLGRIELGDGLQARIVDGRGRLRGGADSPGATHELVSADLSDLCPGWRLGLFHRTERSVEQIVKRQRLGYAAVVVGMVIAMVAGVVVTVAASARAVELSRLQTEFVANVSHELKTPLALIRMYGETLESGLVTDDTKRREFSGIIRHESERLTHLIDNVLDIGRIGEGTKRYRMVASDVVALVRTCLEDYRHFLDRQGFVVDVRLPERPIVRPVDREALAQALVNLLQNAVKHSGSCRRSITVTVCREEDDVAIAVHDHGPGIPARELERIFRRHYRVDGGAGAAGSGLGLAVVRHVAEAHGGVATVASKMGRGSVFTLRLPLGEPTHEESPR